jgi:L-asparaginase
MLIKIIITGGTFDKEYNEITGQLFFKDTHLPEMLRLGRCMTEVNIETVMMMDSLEMNEGHREKILQHCKNAKEDHIVITHGTDTMPETAKYLSGKVTGKTIVLTGAMVPYKFGSSDGLFNLGSALAFVQTLSNGVYVAMNGKCFAADKVRKNKKKGIFEKINPDAE